MLYQRWALVGIFTGGVTSKWLQLYSLVMLPYRPHNAEEDHLIKSFIELKLLVSGGLSIIILANFSKYAAILKLQILSPFYLVRQLVAGQVMGPVVVVVLVVFKTFTQISRDPTP